MELGVEYQFDVIYLQAIRRNDDSGCTKLLNAMIADHLIQLLPIKISTFKGAMVKITEKGNRKKFEKTLLGCGIVAWTALASLAVVATVVLSLYSLYESKRRNTPEEENMMLRKQIQIISAQRDSLLNHPSDSLSIHYKTH